MSAVGSALGPWILVLSARWLDRLTFVATKRGADIWKREDLASRREVGTLSRANRCSEMRKRRSSSLATPRCTISGAKYAPNLEEFGQIAFH
jgi:hypothetical protein